MDSAPAISILMVCMGNICRSPTAHGVMRARIAARGWQDLVRVDSCGTHAYHVGEPADQRARQALGRTRSRRVISATGTPRARPDSDRAASARMRSPSVTGTR